MRAVCLAQVGQQGDSVRLLPKGLPFPPSQALSQPDTGTASLSSLVPISFQVSQKLPSGQRFPWKAFFGPLVFGTPEPPCGLLATGRKEAPLETSSVPGTSLLPWAITAGDAPYLLLIPTSVCIRAWEGGTADPEVDSVTPFKARKIFLSPCSAKLVQLLAAGANV